MADDSEREWRFELDDVDEGGLVTPEPDPIEPEPVELENALFVAVGVIGTLLVFLSAML